MAINKVIRSRTCAINDRAFLLDRGIPLDGYRRALRFIVPYWPRLVFVLLVGIAATGFGLLQPYISKLLIDDALLKHNLRMLLIVSGHDVRHHRAEFCAEYLVELSVCSDFGIRAF